jgi:hypothetical protein
MKVVADLLDVLDTALTGVQMLMMWLTLHAIKAVHAKYVLNHLRKLSLSIMASPNQSS